MSVSNPQSEHLSSKILQVYVSIDTVTISKGDLLQSWELKVKPVTTQKASETEYSYYESGKNNSLKW